MSECEKCKLWDKAATEMGYYAEICEECFNQSFVAVQLNYDSKEVDNDPT